MKQKGDSCNPCYNGYGVHPIGELVKVDLRCNPCYNGYGVHRVIHNVMYLRLL